MELYGHFPANEQLIRYVQHWLGRYALKTALLEYPVMACGQPMPAAFNSYVVREDTLRARIHAYSSRKGSSYTFFRPRIEELIQYIMFVNL